MTNWRYFSFYFQVSIQESGDYCYLFSLLPAPFPPLPHLPTPLSPPATRTKWSPHSPRLFKQDLV
ncbi:MAG: hypothetical protein EWV85_16715 [Microcystis aeruginosa Ma_QC_C_20070703_M131]|uniref:Uncharacterized protein n=1 Tax=Microcystis aeruginosa Ma_QC_C_20070703_M131 TaxID=2486263 RepID=A0A551XN74_MICAE|nr:MAG: hypothetical protein EWV85_16715 [Microcystis aeruginosa Ma_QC_C_20070703_M131]